MKEKIICRGCGRLVDSDSEKCPHCKALLKKGAKKIKLEKEEMQAETPTKPISQFEKLFIIGIIGMIVLVIAISLFVSYGADFNFFSGSNQTEVLENNTSEIVNETNESQADETETEVQPEKTPREKLKDYLRNHEVPIFGEQASRIKTVQLEGSTAYVTYTTTDTDYEAESTYLVGATLMAVEESDKADVKGYNEDGMFMNASHKYKTREDYKFDLYGSWFPDYEAEIECETDADCDDGNECTKDKCYEGKCSNAEIVDCV
ncbi:MAG: hypothetical protein R6U26_02530 [Candidatus Undinarchaeales archaeon]